MMMKERQIRNMIFLQKVLTEKDNNGKSFTQYLWESSLTEEQKMEIVSHIIQYACRDDNLESIKMILQDLTVNKPDFLGKMDDFFILAVKSKSQKGAELILRKAKELDIMQKVLTARNRKKVTALHYAIKTKDIVIIEEILKYAKDSQIIEKVLTARNLQEATPFYLAIKECSIDAVEKIIEYIEKKPELLKKVLTTKVQGFTTFHYAIQKKEIKVINKILESAESCGVLEKVLKEETRGITPLHYAMRIKSLEAIKKIIEYSSRAKNDDERKADPQYDFLKKVLTEKDNNGKSFMQYLWESSIAEEQKMEIVIHIIKCACRDDNLESVKMIFQDLTVNKPDFLGKMDDFFILAVKSKSQKGAELILRKAIEQVSTEIDKQETMIKVITATDRENKNQDTALQVAIKANSQENVELILRKAKELDIMQKVLTATNHNGQTPIETAIMTENLDYCQEALTYMAQEEDCSTFKEIFYKERNIFFYIPDQVSRQKAFRLIFETLSNEGKTELIDEFTDYLPEDQQEEAKALSQEIQQEFGGFKKRSCYI